MKHEIRAVSNWAHWFLSWARPSRRYPYPGPLLCAASVCCCICFKIYMYIFRLFCIFHSCRTIYIHSHTELCCGWVIFQVLRAVCSAASVASQRKGRDFLYVCVLWVFLNNTHVCVCVHNTCIGSRNQGLKWATTSARTLDSPAYLPWRLAPSRVFFGIPSAARQRTDASTCFPTNCCTNICLAKKSFLTNDMTKDKKGNTRKSAKSWKTRKTVSRNWQRKFPLRIYWINGLFLCQNICATLR